MKKYIARRLFLFIPTLLGVSIVIFALLRMVPGDVAAVMLAGPSGDGVYTRAEYLEMRTRLGLDRPLYVQYADWMWDLMRGDLGVSLARGRPIWGEIKRQFPVSLQLGILTVIITWSIAIPIGILAAVKQDSLADYGLRGVAIMGLAMPSFFTGMLIVLGLSQFFNWVPPLGFVNLWQDPVKSIQQLIFPALALGFAVSGVLLRITRTQLLETMREDYVRTARAKGLAEPFVIMRHAVRNSLLPVVTAAGTQIGVIFSGTVVIENIFNVPGIGRGLLAALFTRDLPMVQVYIVYFALIALAINLMVDLTYAWLDPRIRYE